MEESQSHHLGDQAAPGVRFSNGKPFDAEAVVFSVNRLRQPAFKDQEQFLRNTGVVEVKVIDNYTVQFVTGKPVPLLPDFLSMLLIAEPSHYRDLPIEKAATTPVGTGPYTLVEWVKDDHLSLVANPKWWGGEVKTDVIIFRPIKEDSTRINEVATGGVDLTTGFSAELAKRLEGNASVRIVAVPGSYNTFVGMRQEFEPLKKREVRLALNLAVDVQAIIEALLDGKAKPIGGIANGMYENKALKPYAADASRARQLLAAAGYPNGFRVTMGFPTERYIRGKEVAQAVAADLGRIGLQVELKPYEWSLYLRNVLNHQTDPLYLFSIGGYFTGQQELFWVHPDNVVNNTFWRDEAFLKSYTELASSFDPQRRMQLIRDLQARVLEEAPWLFLYKAADVYAISTRLQRWEPEPSGRIWLWDATVVR